MATGKSSHGPRDPEIFERAIKRLIDAHASEFRRFIDEEHAAQQRRLLRAENKHDADSEEHTSGSG